MGRSRSRQEVLDEGEVRCVSVRGWVGRRDAGDEACESFTGEFVVGLPQSEASLEELEVKAVYAQGWVLYSSAGYERSIYAFSHAPFEQVEAG
jgi:hypothetical protein